MSNPFTDAFARAPKLLTFALMAGGTLLVLARDIEGIVGTLAQTLAVGIILVAAVAALLAYLAGEPSVSAVFKTSARETVRKQDLQGLRDQLGRLEEKLGRVFENGHSGTRSFVGLTEDDRKVVVDLLKEQLIGDLKNDFVETLTERLFSKTADALSGSYLSEFREQATVTQDRLRDEIGALSRRANLNLVIGTLTTLLAAALLGYMVLTAEVVTGSLPSFVWHYGPRLSVIVFIEVFSFFFLRLYRTSLNEIKYFQNELTNVDIRLLALEAAFLSRDRAVYAAVVEQLARTERNFILAKGESTVEVERSRLEREGVKDMIGALADTIKKSR